jgi:hypothetical protein
MPWRHRRVGLVWAAAQLRRKVVDRLEARIMTKNGVAFTLVLLSLASLSACQSRPAVGARFADGVVQLSALAHAESAPPVKPPPLSMA